MAAELRLNVALDLQYFKAQLPKLARAAAGFQLPLQVKFDRRSLNNEFRLLGNQLSKRRDFRIQVNDTAIKAARENAENLVKYLQTNLTGKKHIVEIEYREKGRPAAVGTSGGGGGGAGPAGARRPSFLDNPIYKAEIQRIQRFNAKQLAKAAASLPAGRNRQEVERLLKAYSEQRPTGASGKGALDAIRQLIARGAVQRDTGVQASMRQGIFGHIASGQTGGPVIPDRFSRIGASGQMPRGSGLPMLPPAGGTSGNYQKPITPTTLPAVTSNLKIPNIPSLPGAGAVRELTAEFGNATKQVLLFGTAYKGLAFLMDFPAQVKDAVASLQSFRNTLNAIIPDASAAAEANQFILDVVDKYNVPLQTARDGFVKMYASMEPSGFSGEDIEGLFLGVSQAAATFGLSADKVDRVQYAFAQMASKGQVMSEELKGQLGDVLPGAMGLFAKAAGLEGPDAIQKFSKALEDGAFKGENMVALLRNVGTVMQTDFGAGAEGAAKSFQGLMNDMSTQLTKLYEAFEPLAVEFLQGFVVPLTNGLKTAADGLTAFFKQTKASTSEGQAFADKLEEMRSHFDGIKDNVQGVIDTFLSLGKALAPIAQLFVQIAGSPLVGYLARLYAIVLPMNMALKTMRGMFASNAVQMLLFNRRIAGGQKTLVAFRAMMAATGKTAAATTATIRGFGIALKAALASTVVGAVVVGIGMIIEGLMTMGDKARAAAEEVARLKQTLDAAAEAGEIMPVLTDLQTKQAATDAALKRYKGLESGEITLGARGARKGRRASAQEVEAARQVYMQSLAPLEEAQERFNVASTNAAEKKRLGGVSLEAVSLDPIDDGSGTGSGKRQMTADELAVVEAINQKRREGNDLAVAHLEFAQQLLDIRNSDLDANEQAAKLDTARTDHAEKIAKITEDNAKKTAKALEEQKNSRHTLAQIVLDAKLASGEISKEEYKVQKFLLEQEATRRRIAGLPGLTQEERDAATGAVNQMKPPQEKGDAAQWIEKTEAELTNFEGMAVSVADNVSSEFGSMFGDIMSGTTSIQEGLSSAFANISKMFADMVAQMLVKWAMLQVMKSIFPGMPGMADGGVVNAGSNGVVPKLANGGIVKGPTMAMVGEGRYNEAVVPLPNGKSIPVEMGKGAGGNVNSSVVVNINNSGGAQSSTKGSQGNQLAKGIEGAVKDVIMREMRPGGMIASRR